MLRLLVIAGPAGHLHTVLTDVSVPEQANRLRDDMLRLFGRLDIVVASLGIPNRLPLNRLGNGTELKA